MKKQVITLFAVMQIAFVFAQEGNWKISSASTPTGASYTGTVSVEKFQNIHLLSWETSVGNYSGVGIVKGNSIYAGYGVNIDYGIVVYELQPDGSLIGIWSTNKANGMTGTEKVVGAKSLNGTFNITGTNAGTNTAYKGTLTIKKTGSVYSLYWKVANTSYNGVGILDGNILAVGWGFGQAFGVVGYDVNGDEATGTWAMGGGTSTGTENLKK